MSQIDKMNLAFAVIAGLMTLHVFLEGLQHAYVIAIAVFLQCFQWLIEPIDSILPPQNDVG